MSEDYSTDEALSELGYANKSGGGGKVIIIILALLLLVASGAAVFMAKRWSDGQSKILTFNLELKKERDQRSLAEAKSAELSSLLADKQSENERIKEEWSNQIATLRSQHKEQLQRTYGQMNEIVYDSRKTLAYIGDIETRLRDGQNIDRAEAAKLANVVNGLAFLYEQYKKPMAEFRELDQYFTRQLASIPKSEAVDPKTSTPPLQRLFKGKKYKQAQEEYKLAQAADNQNKGKKDALTRARSEVRSAYSRAQSQMKALDFDKNKYLAQLDQIVGSNNNSAQSVEEFFNSSKEILKIHDKIMNIKPVKTTTVKP